MATQSLIEKIYFGPYQHALKQELIKLLFQPKITAKSRTENKQCG